MQKIRIGTRNSPLALWQAREVARNLQNLNYKTEITPIVASGDKDLSQPLYSMGITGVFTRDLDLALLNGEIEIAVHSLKDVPTQLPENIELISCLKRDFPQDVLVRRSGAKQKSLQELTIATSSLRRRAFWSKEFPNTTFCDIRGNVHTRLKKLEEGNFDATLFSLAGIKRMNLAIPYEELPFMLSAPSQGVIAIAGLSSNTEIKHILLGIEDQQTRICVTMEREFLSTLEGGCTAPIGAFAEIIDDQINFKGRLTSLDGKNSIEVEQSFALHEADGLGKKLAEEILNNGGSQLMAEIKKTNNDIL